MLRRRRDDQAAAPAAAPEYPAAPAAAPEYPAAVVAAPLLLAALAALAALAGCGPPANPGGAAASGGVPRRIVSLAPSLTETAFALGLGPHIVGVDDYSAWPPAVAHLPRVGGLFNSNLERLVSLRPDLVLLLPSERDIGAKLQRLGIASLIVPAENLADVRKGFLAIASRCGIPQEGERAAAAWAARLAPPSDLPAQIAPPSDPLAQIAPAPGGRTQPGVRVMLSIDRPVGRLASILVAAHGTFLDELLARLGGVNVFADAASLYPQVGMEEVLARAPQVILELRTEPAPPAVASALIADWRQEPSLPALRDGRIAVIAGDYVLVPGPRLPLLYEAMRRALQAPGAAPRPGG